MAVAEAISQCVQHLPEPMQAEVLRFAESLKAKVEEDMACEDRQWSELSLSLALSDMANEEGPEYSVSDIRETFS